MKPKILILDDEHYVLRALRRTLVRAGFDVVSAASAVQAMCIMESEEEDIAVVISDERMPGSTGTTFLRWCSQVHPNVGRILLTGFLDDEVEQHAHARADVYRVFRKPWNVKQLGPAILSAVTYHQLFRA